MIRPVANIEALIPSRNVLAGADSLATAIFARAVAWRSRLLLTAHKTSQAEQTEQAKPAPIAASTICGSSSCSGSILVALVTLAASLSQRRQSQRQGGKTQSQYSRSNVSFHCCSPPLQSFDSKILRNIICKTHARSGTAIAAQFASQDKFLKKSAF
jgi:hypothetical protein